LKLFALYSIGILAWSKCSKGQGQKTAWGRVGDESDV
jgi:hypothetical protein